MIDFETSFTELEINKKGKKLGKRLRLLKSLVGNLNKPYLRNEKIAKIYYKRYNKR